MQQTQHTAGYGDKGGPLKRVMFSMRAGLQLEVKLRALQMGITMSDFFSAAVKRELERTDPNKLQTPGGTA